MKPAVVEDRKVEVRFKVHLSPLDHNLSQPGAFYGSWRLHSTCTTHPSTSKAIMSLTCPPLAFERSICFSQGGDLKRQLVFDPNHLNHEIPEWVVLTSNLRLRTAISEIAHVSGTTAMPKPRVAEPLKPRSRHVIGMLTPGTFDWTCRPKDIMGAPISGLPCMRSTTHVPGRRASKSGFPEWSPARGAWHWRDLPFSSTWKDPLCYPSWPVFLACLGADGWK